MALAAERKRRCVGWEARESAEAAGRSVDGRERAPRAPLRTTGRRTKGKTARKPQAGRRSGQWRERPGGSAVDMAKMRRVSSNQAARIGGCYGGVESSL